MSFYESLGYIQATLIMAEVTGFEWKEETEYRNMMYEMFEDMVKKQDETDPWQKSLINIYKKNIYGSDKDRIEEMKNKLSQIDGEIVVERNSQLYPTKQIFFYKKFYLMTLKENGNPLGIDDDDWYQRVIPGTEALKYYDEVMFETLM